MSAQVVKKRIRIGLTGNIASGKSEALSYIKELGYDVIDSDLIVKEMWSDPYHVTQLSEIFHRDLTKEDVKKAFVKEIFSNQTLRLALENYIHPVVYQNIESRSNALGAVVVIDVPLLYETHHQEMFDAVILVVVDEHTQLKRLLERGYDEVHAKKRMEAQMPYHLKTNQTPYHLNGLVDSMTFQQSIKDILRKILNR
jgi:dephospho-CoA kinase